MTSIERTAYPRFKRQFTTKELTEIYTPTKSEIAFAYNTTKGESNILNLLVILKSFQRLGYFPSIADIPLKIINHIRSHLKLALDIVLGYENNKTMYRHRTAIREYLQVKSFNQTALHLAVSALNESAQVMDNPADLMNVAIAELIKNRYELPGFNTLNRLVRRVRNVVNQNLFNLVLSRLSNDYKQRLLDLLDNHPVEYRSLYNNLKQLPKHPTRNHLNDLIVHSIWLDSLGDIKPLLADMTAAKIQHFATEARVLDASEIKEFNLSKRITLILCLIYSASVMTRDNLVEMFLKKMQLIHNHAKKELELIKQRYQESVEKLLGVFSNVLQVLVDEPPEVGTVLKVDKVEQVNQVLIPSGGSEKLLSECEAINAYKGNNYFPLLWQFYKSHRSTFFRLLGALKFSSTTNEQSVVEALNFILKNQSRRGQFFNNTIDLDFASPQWQKLLFVEQGNKTKIVRRHLEVCVFSYLMAELRSGDICVKGSENYADHREQLLPWSECLPLIDQYCGDLGFASDAVGNVYQLKSLLTDTAMLVDAGYPDNRQLVINDLGEPVLKKSPRHDLSPSAKTLLEAVEQRFGERNLIDILRNVDYWTNFTRHFGPMSGSDPKLERATERYLLTSFTYGCNLGPTQAARHMRGIVTSKEISFVNRRHVSVDKLNAALVDIINRYNVLKLPSIWGDGTTAAADGTKYEQEKIVKYNDLVANAVIFHNVVDLTEVLRDFLKSGYLITREDVAALSPYMTSHIKRFGDYLIDMETVPDLLDDDKLLVLA